MPPKKELCRNFMRGSCQYGERCKFLHAAQTSAKPNPFGAQTPAKPNPFGAQTPANPNPFGFGVQTSNQFQQTSQQQQTANPFGFGVQNNSQPRGFGEFGSKQNQFKAFENKWTRTSTANMGSSAASRQPDNQPPSHSCKDPESCKRQMREDFESERPLWKLTCYGHSKYGPCDIVGDISYEELRATAYEDAKRGLSLQSIVERERNLLNSKLVEFDSLMRNPYKGTSNSAFGLQSPFPSSTSNTPVTAQNGNPPSFSSFSQLGNPHKGSSNSAFGLQSPFPTNTSNTPVTAQNGNPPSFSSFNQLGTSLGGGATAPPNNVLGQQHAFGSGQTSSMFKMTNSPFQSSGFGSQLPSQTLRSPVAPISGTFGSNSINTLQNPFASQTSTTSSVPNNNMNSNFASFGNNPANAVLPSLTSTVSSRSLNSGVGTNSPFSVSNANVNEDGLSTDSINLRSNTPQDNLNGDNSIWMKEEWSIGQIPEAEPPAEYCK